MSENSENNTEVSNTQSADAGTKVEVTSIEAAQARIKELENNFQEAVVTRDKAKEKLRKLEQDFGQASELKTKYDELFTEKSKLLEQFESVQSEFTNFKTGIQQEKVSATLQSAIEKAGAKSVSTVLKLIDKSKVELDENGNAKEESISALIKELSESDPILFGTEFIDPGVKRAGDGTSEGMYDKELKACKNQREIENVLRKYGKL
jgi:predicted nuclease with TOPRIM domain